MSILLEIVPASIIYDTNNVHVTTREIYSQLADYRKLTQDATRHYADRVQAWQCHPEVPSLPNSGPTVFSFVGSIFLSPTPYNVASSGAGAGSSSSSR